MNKFLRLLIFSVIFSLTGSVYILAADIPDFTVRESEMSGENIEMIALDAEGAEHVTTRGEYVFSINGFETSLKFKEGVAGFPRDVSSSTFLYIKHDGESGAVSRLFYVYRAPAGSYSVFHIPLAVIVIVPLGLILLGVFFRRLIILMVVLLGAFFYFSNMRGFSLDSFFDAAREWITGLL